jgi:hypothetical protein
MKSKLLMILFFGVFFAIGVGIFVFSSIPMLQEWHAAKTWHPTDAELLSHNLESHHSDDSTTYQVKAKYRYSFAGNSYISERVAISQGSDNIGSFHQDLSNRLSATQNQGGRMTVWVNPQQPSESLIDKTLRIPLLLFQSIFLVVFGGVGAGGIYFVLRSAKKHEVLSSVDKSSPWQSRAYWASPTMNSNVKTGAKMMMGFAVVWSVISLAPLFMGIQGAKEGEWIALIALLFPLVGIGLLYAAFKMRRSFNRTGYMPLTLDPYPGSIGGQLGGTIRLVSVNPEQIKSSEVTVGCVGTYRSGKNTRTSSIWQKSMVPLIRATADGAEISFCFDLHGDLPESEPSNSIPYKSWKASLSLELEDNLTINREYVDLPVFKTAEKSKLLNRQAYAATSAATALARDVAVDNIIDVQELSDGYAIDYPIGRNKWGLGLVVFGSIFVAIGLAIPDWIFKIVFPGIGGLIAILGFYFFSNSLNIRIGSEGITSVRRILGITVRTRFLPSFSFKEFKESRSHSASSGNKHSQYYSIIAHGHEGQKLVVAENLKGLGEAEAAIEKLNRLQDY